MKPLQRVCLNCGMGLLVAPSQLDDLPVSLICTKCDDNIYLQSKGTCLTRDIAHQKETVVKALQKLDEVILAGWDSYHREIRIIVGGGLIRQQVLGQLHYYQQQGKLRTYREESPNHGAIIVVIRST